MSQLHLLRFEDGELETLDLSAEQWRLASTNSTSLHTPTLTTAAAARQVQLAVATGTDGGTSPSDESTWWADFEQSVSERPLRVVLDSFTGRFRVLQASEVLQAELAMRQQQHLEQQQHCQQHHQQQPRLEQQQRHHNHHQQLQQQWEEEEEQAAVTAEWWQGQQGGGFMLGSSLNNIGSSSSGSSLLQAPAAAGAGGLAPAAHDAFDFAAAAAAAAAASHAAPFAAAGEAAPGPVAAGRDVDSASGGSKRRRLLYNSPAVAPAGAFRPSQPRSRMPAPLTNAATPAAGVQDIPGPDTAVDIVCNDSKQGTYLINANVVVCGCTTCLQQQMRTGRHSCGCTSFGVLVHLGLCSGRSTCLSSLGGVPARSRPNGWHLH